MSFTTQRLLNKFPQWAVMRYDPSSQGARFFNPFGQMVEEQEFDYLRISKLNEVILSGGSLYELDRFYYIDLNFLLTHENILLNKPNFIFPKNYRFYKKASDIDPVADGSSGSLTPYDFKTNFYFTEMVESWKLPALKVWDSSLGLRDGLHFQEDEFINPDVSKAYKLMVVVRGSTHYKRFNGEDENDPFPYGGHHKIVLRGIGEAGERIIEHIQVQDDGIYLTRNKFLALEGDKKINKPAVEIDGFDGFVSILLEGLNAGEKVCPFKLGVTIDGSNGFYHNSNGVRNTYWPRLDSTQLNAYKATERAVGYEGPLLTSLSSDEDEEGNSFSFIDYYFHIFSNGQSYRRKENEIEEEEDLKELLASQVLLSSLGEAYTAVDFAFNWWDGNVWILDSEGIVHVHAIEPTPFEEWTFPRTKTIDIDLQPLNRRAVYGEELPCYTWHKILRRPIQKVTIYRESPEAMKESKDNANLGILNEPKFRGDYLHYDEEERKYFWDKSPNSFESKDPSADIPENSWKDFKFPIEFKIQKDEEGNFLGLGQWNFYCETILKGNKKTSLMALEKQLSAGLIKEEDYFTIKEELIKNDDVDILQRSCTSIMCEYSQAIVDIDVSSIQQPFGIWFDGIEQKMNIVGVKENEFYVESHKLSNNKFLLDSGNQILLMSNDYEKVEFDVETRDIEENDITLKYTFTKDESKVEVV